MKNNKFFFVLGLLITLNLIFSNELKASSSFNNAGLYEVDSNKGKFNVLVLKDREVVLKGEVVKVSDFVTSSNLDTLSDEEVLKLTKLEINDKKISKDIKVMKNVPNCYTNCISNTIKYTIVTDKGSTIAYGYNAGNSTIIVRDDEDKKKVEDSINNNLNNNPNNSANNGTNNGNNDSAKIKEIKEVKTVDEDNFIGYSEDNRFIFSTGDILFVSSWFLGLLILPVIVTAMLVIKQSMIMKRLALFIANSLTKRQ